MSEAVVPLQHIYTIQDLEAFNARLHLNTFLTLFFNGTAIYLILKHSTKAMEKYKFYILFTILSAVAVDIHITVIFSPFPLFPFPAFCGAGLFRNSNWFWGESFQYATMHVTLTFAGCSILVGLIYQYYSLCDNVEFFHTRKGVFIIFFLMSLYPIPSLTLHLLSGYDNKKFIQDIKTRAPHLYPLVISAPCNGTPFNSFTVAYLIDTIFQIVAVFVAFLVIFYKILKKWTTLKHTMSTNTLKLRKQYLMTLCLQMSVPFMFIVVPIVGLMLAVIFKTENIIELSQLGLQILALHSCVNSILIMLVIKPYKQQLQKWFDILFFEKRWKRKKSNAKVFVSLVSERITY